MSRTLLLLKHDLDYFNETARKSSKLSLKKVKALVELS